MSFFARRTHGPLLLVAFLAAYGSLYPFRFAAPPSLAHALRVLFAQKEWWTSRGDVAGNVLLFVPLGVAIVYATLEGSEIYWRRAIYALGALAFALLLQIAQIYVPARTAALSDVLWNGVGTLIGIGFGQFVLSRLPRWSMHGDRHTHLALLVVVFWLGWRLWPFEAAFGIPQVYRVLRALIMPGTLNLWSVASMAVSLLLIASMVHGLRAPQRWLIGAAALGLLARFLLAGQAISVSVLAGTLIGLAAGLAVLRAGIARAGPLVMLVAVIWYSAESLRPFAFSAHRTPISVMPFEALLRGAMDINLAALCGVAFLTGALMLTGTRLHNTPGRWSLLLSAWILLLELVQQWLPTRTSDITIALLPFGWWLALRPSCTAAKAGA